MTKVCVLSQALCELLEEQLHDLKLQLNERDAQVALLQEEMALQKAEINSLRKSLRYAVNCGCSQLVIL